MKIQSNSLEIRVLKTLTCSNKKQLGKLVRLLNEDNFQSNIGLEIYRRVMTLVKDRGIIIGWDELCSDPALRESTRAKISKYKKPAIKNENRLDLAISTLTDYTKMRASYETAKYIMETLDSETVEVEKFVNTAQTLLNSASIKKSDGSDFIDIGTKSDRKARKLIRNILKDSSHRYIPTGIREFDNRNIGIPRGTFFVIQTNSGGGKSVLANQMCGEMAALGARVCLVPLEMTGDENTRRHVSRVTDTLMSSVVNTKKLSVAEKDRIVKSWLQYNNRIKQAKGLLTIYTPKEDITVEDILFTLKPRNYDAIIIDYIGLLKGTDGEDQARKLGAAGRFCKRFADINDMCVGVCAQLSDDNKVRYARAINEHSGLSFSWQYDKAAKENKIVKVEFPKSRNLDPQPLYLTEEFEHMRFSEVSNAKAEKIIQANSKNTKSNIKQHSQPKVTRNKEDTRTVTEEDFAT